MVSEAGPGLVIGGRYRLIQELGSGGFGRVWKAADESLRVNVALKEVWLPPASSPTEHRKRLAYAVREARNAAQLRDHPHIVAVHDVIVEDDLPWTVMRLVDGHSLEQHLAVEGPISLDEATNLATALLKALKAAHDAGITHRDVKPANVMITTAGEALLTDFGISARQADTALTTTGSVIGSAEYMAPERLNGVDGPAGDLFSLGAVLYQALEGVSPFRRDTPTATLGAVALHNPEPPQRAGRLAPLILALLAKEPGERPNIEHALETLQHLALKGAEATKILPGPDISQAMTPDETEEIAEMEEWLEQQERNLTSSTEPFQHQGTGQAKVKNATTQRDPSEPRSGEHEDPSDPVMTKGDVAVALIGLLLFGSPPVIGPFVIDESNLPDGVVSVIVAAFVCTLSLFMALVAWERIWGYINEVEDPYPSDLIIHPGSWGVLCVYFVFALWLWLPLVQ